MSRPEIIELIKNQGGIIRMSDAINMGITRYTLYSMLEQGDIDRLSRGVYQLSDMPLPNNLDFTVIGSRIPKAVICLISALSYHELTTQIPHKINIALPSGIKTPKLDYPPISVFHFSASSYKEGIETYQQNGVTIQVYNPEKTLIDCFKFRNKIGMDVVLEALKLYKERHFINVSKLMEYAKICRVSNVVKPYLEASI